MSCIIFIFTTPIHKGLTIASNYFKTLNNKIELYTFKRKQHKQTNVHILHLYSYSWLSNICVIMSCPPPPPHQLWQFRSAGGSQTPCCKRLLNQNQNPIPPRQKPSSLSLQLLRTQNWSLNLDCHYWFHLGHADSHLQSVAKGKEWGKGREAADCSWTARLLDKRMGL